jgi:hypothetical protein
MPKIGILAPLMLDSVFQDDQFRYKKSFPKFIVPGLDFVQGAEIALDSLSSTGAKAKLFYYDSKGKTEIAEQIERGDFQNLDMIIAAVREPEFSLLANYVRQKKTILISAIYPNDGGIKNNPNLVIINGTLKSHCERIFSQLFINHTNKNKILLVKQAGSQEDKIHTYLKSINEQDGKPLMKITKVDIDSNFTPLIGKLDSNLNNIIIAGSLDEEFAEKLIASLVKIDKKYKLQIFGMPNWENFDILKKGKNKTIPVHFTASYYNDKTDSCSKYLQRKYEEKYKGLPSSAAYKGFEYVFYFTELFCRYSKGMMDHLNEGEGKMYSGFNFLPVHLSSPSLTDYYENKHLFMLKSIGGKTEILK